MVAVFIQKGSIVCSQEYIRQSVLNKGRKEQMSKESLREGGGKMVEAVGEHCRTGLESTEDPNSLENLLI